MRRKLLVYMPMSVLQVGQMYGGGPNHRTQERVILVKNEPQVEVSPGILMGSPDSMPGSPHVWGRGPNSAVLQVVAVKTEPKLEPGEGQAGQYSLADLDGITDLLPIQTGARVPCTCAGGTSDTLQLGFLESFADFHYQLLLGI